MAACTEDTSWKVDFGLQLEPDRLEVKIPDNVEMSQDMTS